MRRFRSREALSSALLCCLLALVPARTLFGQAALASISGRVTDSSGGTISDAPITIRNIGTSATRTVVTDAQGRYFVPDLAIGTYTVTAMKMGFQTAVRQGVTLTVGSAPVIDFQLGIGQTSQTVNVEATVSQVETNTGHVFILPNRSPADPQRAEYSRAQFNFQFSANTNR